VAIAPAARWLPWPEKIIISQEKKPALMIIGFFCDDYNHDYYLLINVNGDY
jgi:hypothetical protein